MFKDRVRGPLIGGVVGDALGFPVEFIYSYEEIQKRYGENGITRLRLQFRPYAMLILNGSIPKKDYEVNGLINVGLENCRK